MSGHRAETATRLGLTLACGGAAFAVSFAHVLEVAETNGQSGWAAWAIAASVDALALVGGLEIRRSHRAGMRTWPGWGLVLLGVAMTVAANLETAAPTAWGAAMAVWPAVAFLALAGVVERRAPDPDPGPLPADSAIQLADQSESEGPEERRRAVAELRAEGLATRAIAERIGVSQPTVLRDLRAIEEAQ